MSSFQNFSFYGSSAYGNGFNNSPGKNSLPVIHSDLPQLLSPLKSPTNARLPGGFSRKNSSSANSNNILGEITNKFGALAASKSQNGPTTARNNGSAKIQLQKTLKQLQQQQDQQQQPKKDQVEQFSMILPLKLQNLSKPAADHQNVFYQTSEAKFWQITQHGELLVDGAALIEDFANSQTKEHNVIIKIVSSSYNTPGSSTVNVSISGANMASVLDTKFQLLSAVPKYTHKRMPISQSFFNDFLIDLSTSKIDVKFLAGLDSVSQFFNVEVVFADTPDLFSPGFANSSYHDNKFYLHIVGTEIDVAAAELRCKLLVDDFRSLFIDSIDTELSIINLIAGINLDNFKNIIKQTGIFIYIPSLLNNTASSLCSQDSAPSSFPQHDNNNKIFLSGSQSQILHAKFLLKQLRSKAKESLFFKDLRINKIKLNYMLANMKNALHEIMYNNGSFIQFPNISSASDKVRVQAINESFVEKTLKDIMDLQSKIYELEVAIDTGTEEVTAKINWPQVQASFEEIARVTNTVVLMNNTSLAFKIIGLNSDVKKALQLLKDFSAGFVHYDTDFYSENRAAAREDSFDFNSQLSSLTNETIKVNANALKFQYKFGIELPNTERDFICGKKNGKLLKIMNQTSTSIQFTSMNEYNFFIEVTSGSVKNAEIGLKLLELEFPAEMSFYIPEIYHRQIIGIGGNLIQSIMRKYNVFIKFSNTFELKQDLISFRRFENVLIKCPNKNSVNIPKVKAELEMLVRNCQELNYISFKLSESQYRMFLNNFNGSSINEIEKKTNSYISFPEDFYKVASTSYPSPVSSPSLSGSPSSVSSSSFGINASETQSYELVEIKGIDTKSAIEAFKALSKSIAKEIKVTISSLVSNSFKTKKIISSSNEEFLNKVVVPFKIFLNTEIKVVSEGEIVLSFNDISSRSVALESLEEFLKSYDFKVVGTETLDLTYNLIETKKVASSAAQQQRTQQQQQQQHFHSQSLNLHYNANPSYKQNMVRSPPTYGSGNSRAAAMQFSPIRSEIQSFSFPAMAAQTPGTIGEYQVSSPVSPVEMSFASFPVVDLSQQMQGGTSGGSNGNGLLPAYDVNSRGRKVQHGRSGH